MGDMVLWWISCIAFSVAMMSNVSCLQYGNHVMTRKQSQSPLLPTWYPLVDGFLHDNTIRHVQDYSDNDVTTSSRIPFKCPTLWGMFPYPEDCSKHYLCFFGKPSIKKCEKENLFEAKKKNCEDKEKVHCGSRHNPYGLTVAERTITASFGRTSRLINIMDTHSETLPTVASVQVTELTSISKFNLKQVTKSSFVFKITIIAIEKPSSEILIIFHVISLTSFEQIISLNKTSLPEVTTPDLISSTTFKQVITPINTSLSGTVTPFTVLTPSKQVTTSNNTLLPETSNINHLISSKVPKQVTSPIYTPLLGTITPSKFLMTTSEPVITPTITPLSKTSNTNRLISSTASKRVTSPINTPFPETTTLFTLLTTSKQVTTSNNTLFPETSNINRLVSSTAFNQVTDATNTPFPETTTPSIFLMTTSEQVTTPNTISLPETSNTNHLIPSTASKQVTSPINTPLLRTITPSTLRMTASQQVITSNNTPLPKTSNNNHLISSSAYTHSITPVTTSFPEKLTTAQKSTIHFGNTLTSIIHSFQSSTQGSSTTSQTPFAHSTSIPKSDSTILELFTNSEFLSSPLSTITNVEEYDTSSPFSYVTPRGCTFGDESCRPDETLCPERFGEFPHPDNPLFFVHCDHWRPYLKKCPQGLQFNAQLKVCDWPK